MSNFFDQPGTPYSRLSYLNNQPVYTASPGLDSLLDQARTFAMTDDYYWQGTAFPGSSFTNLAARATYAGIVTVPPLSYITNLTGDCFATTPSEEASNIGFSIRIYDKGAKADTAINAQFIRSRLISSALRQTSIRIKQGQSWLLSPMIVLAPGALQIEITNLSSIAITAQMLLGMAIPLNAVSMNEVKVKNPNGSN